MVFIDTGFLIALPNPKDALHEKARRWLKRCDSPFITTEYVLWEAINALSAPQRRRHAAQRRRHAAIIAQWVQSNPKIELVEASTRWFQLGWQLFQARPDKFWSLTDCISFHLMNERGITEALAYDVHFEQAGFHPLLRRDPP